MKEIKGGFFDEQYVKDLNDNFKVLWDMRNVLQTQINDLVLDAGKSDPEVAQARGGYAVLADHLTAINRTLSQKANQDALNTVNGRVNNLIAHAGDNSNNAELLDIRIGWDGVVYPTAGDAVRSIQQFFTTQDEEWVL